MTYTNAISTPLSFGEASTAIRQALADQGFGILTEIDVQATFAKKLGDESADRVGEYVILGACNPKLAERALAADPSMGALLPCNVVVRRAAGAEATTIEAIDPATMAEVSDAAEVAAVADEARRLITTALAAVESAE